MTSRTSTPSRTIHRNGSPSPKWRLHGLIRSISIAAMLVLLSVGALAQSVKAEDIVGTWEATNKHLKLEMFNAGQEYDARLLYGNKVVESDGVTFKQDSKNPDPSLRSRSLKAIVFVKGLVWDKDQWTGGTIYDGSTGKTYKCKAEIKDGNLHLRGYLDLSAFGQTVILERIATSTPRPPIPIKPARS
jgi:uncharacterized protein (DUF2147 family)